VCDRQLHRFVRRSSAGVAGVVYTLEPDKQGDLSKILQQLDPSEVAEVEELLFAPVDSDSESE
jgi:hypothetical protein